MKIHFPPLPLLYGTVLFGLFRKMVKRAGPVTQFVEAFLSQVRLNEVLAVHAVFCGVVGTLLVLSPHGLWGG